mmetsp:Transcript_44415/g.115439  ORF Transcript_44415/g.115439 Transcript_44415/m.115439 type:complete len:215 (-) Transcript_44415:17-661(-)
MILKNSSGETTSSSSFAASCIISRSSSSVMFSPNSLATFFNDSSVITPSSSSNRWKAFMISSRESFSPIFAVMISKKSLKSMIPLSSLSISDIIFLISSFFGSNPSARSATFSSFASIVPLPSVSKRSKASRSSCLCSSVSSIFPPPFFLPPAFLPAICYCTLEVRVEERTRIAFKLFCFLAFSFPPFLPFFSHSSAKIEACFSPTLSFSSLAA